MKNYYQKIIVPERNPNYDLLIGAGERFGYLYVPSSSEKFIKIKAYITNYGYHYHFKNGYLHRDNGPAAHHPNLLRCMEEHYLNGYAVYPRS